MLTIQIVDFEEKNDLVVDIFPSKLVHGLNKLRHTDCATAVRIKYAEGPLNKKWLNKDTQSYIIAQTQTAIIFLLGHAYSHFWKEQFSLCPLL